MSDEKIELDNYIQEKISYIEKQCILVRNGQVPIGALNDALSRYTGIRCFLIQQYENLMLDFEERKEAYRIDWDDWLLEASHKLNEERVKSKYATGAEIEATARVNHREAYLTWQKELKSFERKVSFYKRLIDSWDAQKDIIIELARNSRGEMKSLGVQNLANYDDRKENPNPKVKVPRT